ncbi:MAG: IS6 family transposase [Gammaproteobacteria bacterium]|nr:IS6 family transposase [Gammaproteobacteria bacterium]
MLHYYCRSCSKQYNERASTKLNFIEYRTEVVMLAIHHYFLYKLSLDDVVELMALRGFSLSHQTVHNWAQEFGVELGIKYPSQRKGKAGKRWHVDATSLKIEGRWCYLYRAIDKEGNLVDDYVNL